MANFIWGATKINELKAGDVYNPKDKLLTTEDVQCLKILDKIMKNCNMLPEKRLKEAFLEIIKQEDYQLLYYDGHTRDSTAYINHIIKKNTDEKPDTLEFNLFIFKLTYWLTEYFIHHSA
ncbi:hypothetical protein Amet_3192 [Alkaliphilus metalliredigens QYMF]|uniref:Uncharacterized protein n=1 Tax=Alkaliphilus metalliredigens (strain QYMF) TaxID=293826 RepID=A6TT12_ALKMQ|nr:DUF5416 family protein [Alkaliphilus metalliredigens]ABR49330.1 hypothetical protein Amet_3192 [Alkaliphilus metalliredigens QYMF]